MTIRASYGVVEDVLYRMESDKALANGIYTIPYHWYMPKKFPVIDQARKFLSTAKHSNMPAMIDLEDYGTTVSYKGVVRELKTWLDIVETAIGIRPFIYSSPSYIQNYLFTDTWLSEYPLILANYKTSAPYVTRPWTPLGLVGWQYVDGADAKYYGFEQALGCALQIFENVQDYSKEWSIT